MSTSVAQKPDSTGPEESPNSSESMSEEDEQRPSQPLPSEESRRKREQIRDRVKGMSRAAVEAHNELTLHCPEGECNFDLSAKRVGDGGRLYRVRRKTIGEMVEWLKRKKKALGLWYNGRQEPRPSYYLPFGAPIPPATSAPVTVREGGNEGWYVRMVILNRHNSKDGPTPYRTPRAWDVWTSKYLSQEPAEQIAAALEEEMWDLGAVSKAKEAWTRWHAEDRWQGEAAECLRAIADLKSTKTVRTERSAWEWPNRIRADVRDAAFRIGWPAAMSLLDLPEKTKWMGGRRVPGR